MKLKKGSIERVSEKKKYLLLRDRDWDALKWVSEQGAVTTHQLCSAVWNASDRETRKYPSRRLRLLLAHDLLATTQVSPAAPEYLVPTPNTRTYLEAYTGTTFPDAPPHLAELPHLERLVDLRIAITRTKALSGWISDRVLTMDPLYPKDRLNNLYPDALWINPVGTRIFLEYERTRKGPSRLKEKLEVYNKELTTLSPTARFMDAVLWVAEGDTYRDLAKIIPQNDRIILRTPALFIQELELGAPK